MINIKPKDLLARANVCIDRSEKKQSGTFIDGNIKMFLSKLSASHILDGVEVKIALTPIEFKLLYCFLPCT